MRSRIVHRMFHTYWRFQRGMTLGVRGLVFDGGRRIFLIRHTYVPGWQLPGGGVEVGETMLEALARELVEEGNISLSAPPRLHGVFYNPTASTRDHVALFVAEHYAQPALPAANHEIAACGWFALDALPEETTPGTRRRIDEVMSGTAPSPRW